MKLHVVALCSLSHVIHLHFPRMCTDNKSLILELPLHDSGMYTQKEKDRAKKLATQRDI